MLAWRTSTRKRDTKAGAMTTDTTRRRVTAADVARSLGVSRATVGFVLNDTPGQTISEATRARVLAEAARLGYRPHTAAQALASGRSHLILLVLPDWPMEYSMRRNIEEASLVLEGAGYSLVTYTPHESSRVRPLWESLNPDVVMGLLPFSDDDIESLHASGVSRIVPDPDHAAAWEEGASITTGPSLQVRHLHDLGHRRLAFAAPTDARLSGLVDARQRAAREAATALGIEVMDVRAVDQAD
jgi:DNA-binding LacI/PurR family transcriptional regulator